MLTIIFNRLGVIVDLLRQILAKQTAIEARLKAVETGQANINTSIGGIEMEITSQGGDIADLKMQIQGIVQLANVVNHISDEVSDIHNEVVPGVAEVLLLESSDPTEQP